MENQLYKAVANCPICDSKDFELILDLGSQPPANSLRKNLDEKLPSIPLRISRCADCTLIFLNEVVDPAFLFSEYVWVTGTSSTAVSYSQFFYSEVEKRLNKKNAFVLEVASNDGTFLKRFKEGGHKVLGVDPAENIAKIAIENGVSTNIDFFGRTAAADVEKVHGKADFVFARNVIPHVANLKDVVSGMAQSMASDGMGAIEFHYSPEILSGLQYDSIYHEHLYYFSLKSMQELLLRENLHVFDISESPISGGSVVVYFSSSKKDQSKELKARVQSELDSGVLGLDAWKKFATRAHEHQKSLSQIVKKYRSAGKRLMGYGASARSSTMLNFCEIGADDLECVADMNEIKCDRLTPGTDIIIKSPEQAFSNPPDVVVLLAWNFESEILDLLTNKFGFKGEVVVPLPEAPRVVTL